MDTQMNDQELQQTLTDRLKQLPRAVQDAIISADVEAHMRELASYHKLHFDQWQVLENNVMLTLLGFQEPEDLASNLRSDLGVTEDVAQALAENISRIVFEPIRAQLETALAAEQPAPAQNPANEVAVAVEHPLAHVVPAIAPILPGTPPAPPPEKKAVRAPISESYSAGQASHERKVVEGDPYRESAA